MIQYIENLHAFCGIKDGVYFHTIGLGMSCESSGMSNPISLRLKVWVRDKGKTIRSKHKGHLKSKTFFNMMLYKIEICLDKNQPMGLKKS